MDNSDKDASLVLVNEETENQRISQEQPSLIKRIGLFVFNNYLPISLIVLVTFGVLVPAPGDAINTSVTKYICIVGIFIYTGVYLKTNAIKEAIKAYRAALWGIISILGVTCVVGGLLTDLLDNNDQSIETYHNNQTVIEQSSLGPIELRNGLQVYMVMPCTVSSGVVMVTQLKGHTALAILLTVTTNIAGIFTVPLYVKWLLFKQGSVKFDIPGLLLKMCLSILLPIMVGKALRCVTRIRKFVIVPNHKRVLKLISVTLLVIIVWIKVSSTSAGGQLKEISIINALFVIGWSIAMHILFFIINTVASIILRLPKDQQKCIILLCSQKTMAVAVSIVALLPKTLGNTGLMVLGLALCHISILLLDSILIPVWIKIEKKRELQE